MLKTIIIVAILNALFTSFFVFLLSKYLLLRKRSPSSFTLRPRSTSESAYQKAYNQFFDGLMKIFITSPLGGMLNFYGGARGLELLKRPLQENMQEFLKQLDVIEEDKNPKDNYKLLWIAGLLGAFIGLASYFLAEFIIRLML